MTLSQSILATLSYHDIFDYPLTLDEIEKYLIGKQANSKNLQKTLKNLIILKKIGASQNYYFLRNRKEIVKKRKKRKIYSGNKLKRALFYSKLLKLIPTIKLVAITGALSMQNCSYSDDIDLMIITTKNNLWTTRSLANILLIFFKRNPYSKNTSNRACLNIFMDEQDLKIRDKNLYTAHEIAQMNILWVRDDINRKFYKENNWVKSYVPNFKPKIGEQAIKEIKIKFPKFIEYASKFIQQKYMSSKITTEKIGERQLFFHPKSTQTIILEKYNKKIIKLNIAHK